MAKELTLLIVDDDEDDRRLFIDSTKEIDEKINCIEAGGGQEALDYLNNLSNLLPDYIFLDLRMPKISGQKCLDEIKKVKRLSEIPIFIYTTSTDKNDISALGQQGAVMFISKPTDPGEIYYLISNIINEKWV